MIVPILALAGSLARKKFIAGKRRHVPGLRSALHRLLVGTVLLVGALTFFPALVARAGGRTLPDARRQAVLSALSKISTQLTYGCKNSFHLRSARSSFRRSATAFKKLNPRPHGRKSGDVRHEVGAVITTVLLFTVGQGDRSVSCCRSPCGSGSRCSSQTSPRRWPKAAARRRPTRCARRARRLARNRFRNGWNIEKVLSEQLRKGDLVCR